MAEPVTIELLGDLMYRSLNELRDIKDQLLVHGTILVRLENRIPLPNDAELAAIPLQVQPLQRRVEAVEGAKTE